MTTTLSSPTSSLSSPNQSPYPTSKHLSAQLDTQIARLNAQLATLRQEKQSLSSALLASTAVQNVVQSRKSKRLANEENATFRRLEEIVVKQQARNDIAVHRLMNNVTSFPFLDRAEGSEGSMLGLRFEMPYTSPSSYEKRGDHDNPTDTDIDTEVQRVYIIVLERMTRHGKTYLSFQPSMNQIPKHIDVEGFAAQYLPLPDAGNERSGRSPSLPASESFQDDSGIDVTQDLTHIINNTNGHTTALGNQPLPITISNTNQSLPHFVCATRNALLSWHYRTAHTTHLLNSLTLPTTPKTYTHAITTISINHTATRLSIEWNNGSTGVLCINEDGHVGIVRVFGPRIGREDVVVDGKQGTYRCYEVERRLEGCRLRSLGMRLQGIAGLMGGDGNDDVVPDGSILEDNEQCLINNST